jgi:dihydroorotate dehydrogenase
VPASLEILSHALRIDDSKLNMSVRSLSCANPIGLAAGFDKDAELLNVLPAFGFGFVELGTFTPLPQEGQKKPRLFRFKAKKALLNRMGFNNPGVKVVAERLKEQRASGGLSVPVGLNIGKGKDTPIEESVDDYTLAFDHVYPYADYIVLNVSSPNTPNLRDLQQEELLKRILAAVTERNRALSEKNGVPPKLIFTKVSPDCGEETLEEIARLSIEFSTGLVATNTTIDHSSLGTKAAGQSGGVSGRPLRERSNYVLKRLTQITKGVVPIIGVGGVFTAEDAYEKIRLGASLVQIYTSWIYEGPTVVPALNRGLLKLMARDGFARLQDAVGTAVK